MDSWRERFLAAQRQCAEDEEDDMADFEQAIEVLEGFIQAESPQRILHLGSRLGNSPNINRDGAERDALLFRDYFSDSPIYGPEAFRRRFRMRRSLFFTIVEAVCNWDPYFVQKPDATGNMGLSSRQKITAALRMLSYGIAADAMDEYCRTAQSTAMECMKRFCIVVRAVFGDYHLRQPNWEDYERQFAINVDRGFPGMFASIDCMHWEWKNCPVAWQGDYGDRHGKKSIILEAIADRDLHIWHAFFGLPGSNNDLNVLDRSSMIHNMLTGAASDMKYTVNGKEYDRYYLLSDSIYPSWHCFVQSIHQPGDEKRKHFAKWQEAVRKDVERAFGVLQARFHIVRNPVRLWSMECISDILYACVILHNMILEDENGVEGLPNILGGLEDGQVPIERELLFKDLLSYTRYLENEDNHFDLRGDLIEHLWALKASSSRH